MPEVYISGEIDFAFVDSYRKRINRKQPVFDLNRQYGIEFLASLLPAHVSLKQPFTFENMEELERYFEALARSIEPFEIELDKVYHTQSGGYGILGINVKNTDTLRELHDRINDELGELLENASAAHDGDSYHFHVTIEVGKVEGEDIYKRYYEELQDRKVNLRFTAKDIALFYYTGGTRAGSFVNYKTVGVGRKPNVDA